MDEWIVVGCEGQQVLLDPDTDTRYSLVEYAKTEDPKLWARVALIEGPPCTKFRIAVRKAVAKTLDEAATTEPP